MSRSALGRWLHGEQGRRERRSSSIRAYVGPNGAGKTLAAVFDLLPSLDAGRPVLSTTRLLDLSAEPGAKCSDPSCRWPGHPDHPPAHPAWIPFVDWTQLLDVTGGDVLMDEVAGVASSREAGHLPFQVAAVLQKLRKRDVTLSWTGPAYARGDKVIRECTQLVVQCRGLFGVAHNDGDAQRSWRTNRLFVWTGYDATTVETWNKSSSERHRPICRGLFWAPAHDVLRAYDTLDPVSSLGWAAESGMCLDCGGKRSIPRCSCDREGHDSRWYVAGAAAHGEDAERPAVASARPVPVVEASRPSRPGPRRVRRVEHVGSADGWRPS